MTDGVQPGPGGAEDAPHLRLAPVEGLRYLGLSATVVATLTVGGDPAPNHPLFLSTSWGGLRFVEGVTTRQGPSLAVRTDGAGTATVSVVPPTSEELREDEQAALNVMLARLDPAAARPADVADALADLAREYRWEANGPFRRAVDVLFRDLRQGVVDTVHAYDFTTAWQTVDAVVTGHVAPDAAGGEVATSAMLQIQFRDWLGAFLQAYGALPDLQDAADARLADVTKMGGDAGVLLANAFAGTRDFVQGERGLVGAHFAPQVADRSLRRFVDTAAASLPLDTRVQLYPAIDATASAVAASGIDVAGAVTRARIDFGHALSTTVAEVDPAGLKQRLGAVESQVTATSSAVDEVKNQVTLNATNLQQVQTQIQANETQLQTFTGRLDVVNQTLNSIDTNTNVIRNRVINVPTTPTAEEPGVAPKAESLESLREEVAALARRVAELEAPTPTE